jgi:hypothetical protein
VFGHGRDLPAGAPAGNDHEIRNRRFSGKLDGDDVFRLVGIERFDDQL